MLKRLKEEYLRGYRNLFWFIVSRVLFHTGLSRLIIFTTNSDKTCYKLYFSKNATAMTTYTSGDIEVETSTFLTKHLNMDSICIDIGANIGTVTIPMAILANSGSVLSFEANPKTYRVLQKNVQLNNLSNVHIYNYALGDTAKLVHFSDKKNDDMNHVQKSNDLTGIKVSMKPLDSFTENIEKVDILKIDVEGYEKYVLLGAIKTLKKTSWIIFEVNNANLENYDYEPREVFYILESNNFKIYNRHQQPFDYKNTDKYDGNYYGYKSNS